MSTVRTKIGQVLLRTRSLIFKVLGFSREIKKSPIKRQRPFGRRFEAGICLSDKAIEILPGCSVRSYGVGSVTTGAIIPRPTMRQLDRNWLSGPGGNTYKEAARLSTQNDTQDRTDFSPRPGDVRTLADGRAAWLPASPFETQRWRCFRTSAGSTQQYGLGRRAGSLPEHCVQRRVGVS